MPVRTNRGGPERNRRTIACAASLVAAILAGVLAPPARALAPALPARATAVQDGDGYVVRFAREALVLAPGPAGTEVTYGDCEVAAEAEGGPALPRVPVLVEIPVDMTAARLEVVAVEERVIATGTDVAPVAPPAHGEEVFPVPPRNAAQYARAGAIPAAWARLASEGFARGHRLVTIELAPARFTAATGELRFAESIRFRLDLAPAADRPRERRRIVPAVEERFGALLDRVLGRAPAPEAARVVPPPGATPLAPTFPPSLDGSPVLYVIITSEAMRPAFEPLADWKTQTGLPAAVVTMEWIAQNYPNGADRAEQVRFFLADAYENWDTLWVLLGGDTEVIPTRYVHSDLFVLPGEPSRILPTDHYYACLDGNWNADKDDRMGEATIDSVDLGPDLFLGRAPVATLAEAEVFVAKTLTYAQSPPAEERYPASILFLAEELNATLDGASIAEDAVALVHPWMRRVRMYENSANFPGSIPLTRTAALDSIDAGFGWVHHVGHGFRNTMSVGDGPDINNQDVDGLVNGPRHAFLFAINCSSASIDYNAIGERWLKNANGGATGYVGTTRLAYPGVSRRYQNEFYRLAFADSVGTAGECLTACRLPWVSQSNTDSPDRWTQMTLVLLGDPDLPLWTNRPQPLAAEHPDTLALGTGVVVTTVRAGGNPVAGATVTLWASGQDWKSGTTAVNGISALPFDPEAPGVAAVAAARRNYLPYTGTIQVVASTPPFLYVQGVVVDDDLSGGSVGNDDGLTNPGETVWLDAFLRNTGLTAATNVTATLVCENGAEHVSIFTPVVTYPNVQPGGTVHGQSHVVRVKMTAPVSFLPRFRIDLTTDQGNWSDIFVLPVYAVRVSQYAHAWSDPPPGGNGNALIEPGESVGYTVELRNDGIGQGVGLEGRLRVLNRTTGLPDPTVTVTAGFAAYGTLDPGARASGSFAFSLGGSAVPSNLRLELTVEDNYDTLRVDLSDLAIPGPVDSLRAIGSADAIRILWERNTDPDLLGFDIYRAASAGGPYTRVNDYTVDGISFFEDAPLAPLTRYYYKVAARDSSFNTGPLSAAVSVSTNPPLALGWPIETGQVTTSGPQIYDFDRDGQHELVMGSDYIYAWRADGSEVWDGDGDPRTSGPFTTWGYSPDNGFRSDAAIADLNRDGSFEIIMAGWGGRTEGKLHVLGPDGNQRPGWPRTFSYPYNWASAAVGQLDQDSQLEIVAMQGQQGLVYAFNYDASELVNGDGNPATIGPLYATNSTFAYGGVALGDFDDDGLDEVVAVANSATGQVFVINGNGTLVPGWPQATGGAITASPAVADLDGVAPPEIVVAAEDDSVYVFKADGGRFPGWPRPAEVFSAQARTSSPVVADLDRNGQLDILFAANDGRFHVWRRDGSAMPGWTNVLFAPDELDADATQATATVGDIDGDGQYEVLLGAEDGRLYAWNHDGTDAAGFPIQLEGEVRSGATIADFDQDGLVEIAVSGYDQNVYVWKMPFAYDPELVPWASFRHDLRNTGNAGTGTAIGVEDPAAAPLPAVFRLGRAEPNPFHPVTRFALEVPASAGRAPIALRIYDVSGRLARVLLAAPLAPGPHRFAWDGRDGRGAPLAAGVYFLAADGPGFSARQKLVLVR